MSASSDEEFKLNVTRLLSEVSTNQKNLVDRIDGYVVANDRRVEDLEHTVNGNGKSGLAEDVRNIKGKWALIYGAAVFLGSTIVQAAASNFFK